ncbi:MAG: hypothetical protein ABSE08_01020 [Syntrophobacteraceae bacterium]
MLLSVIGMSGSGKSYWAEKLSRRGFRRFCLDSLIAQKISAKLGREDGSLMTLGEWMGFPFQDGYQGREDLYLSAEKQLMTEVLDWIEENACAGSDENVVVDTTGSVIYVGEDILNRLRSLTTVINFTFPTVVREAMLRQYMSNPRPVLWRGFFNQEHGESVEDALFRCYHELLDSREIAYRELTDIEIDYFTRNSPVFRIVDFLEIATKAAKKCHCAA